MWTEHLNSSYIKYSPEATCFQQGHETKNTRTLIPDGNRAYYRNKPTVGFFHFKLPAAIHTEPVIYKCYDKYAAEHMSGG